MPVPVLCRDSDSTIRANFARKCGPLAEFLRKLTCKSVSFVVQEQQRILHIVVDHESNIADEECTEVRV
jgi:hypothetical protein